MSVQALQADLDRAHHLVVLTGAGMGPASGIPTFRGTDPNAVWSNDVMTMATNAYFERDPVGSWRWYLHRFDGIRRCEPNSGHHAVVALERWQRARGRELLLVTQNIDTLHRRAGSGDHVEVHGRADRVRCVRRGCRLAAPNGSIPRDEVDFAAFEAQPALERLPRCPACGALVRPHVLWFDEYYQGHAEYQYSRVMAAFEQADLVLCVGTSFSVGITAAAQACGALLWTIDPGTQVPRGIRQLRGAQEVVLPELVAELAGD